VKGGKANIFCHQMSWVLAPSVTNNSIAYAEQQQQQQQDFSCSQTRQLQKQFSQNWYYYWSRD